MFSVFGTEIQHVTVSSQKRSLSPSFEEFAGADKQKGSSKGHKCNVKFLDKRFLTLLSMFSLTKGSGFSSQLTC